MPEAMPLREWCTTPIAVEASGGLISADADAREQEAGNQRRPARARVDGRHREQPGAYERHAHAEQ